MIRAGVVVVAVLSVACARSKSVPALELARQQVPPAQGVTAGVVQFRGSTVSGATVDVLERSGRRHQVTTGADGTFTLETPIADVTQIIARSGELMGFVSEPPHDWVDVVLVHPQMITGVLIDAAGTPVVGAEIETGLSWPSCMGARGDRPHSTVTTDASGRFSVPAFSGEAWVGARGASWMHVATWGRAVTDVRLTRRAAASQSDESEPGDAPPPANATRFEATVSARSSDGQPLAGLHLGDAREVSASRSWWLTPEYQRERNDLVASSGEPLRMKVARRGYDATSFALEGDGPRYAAQVQLAPAHGVTITITDPEGRVFPGCEVRLKDEAQNTALSDARGELWVPVGPHATRVRGAWCCEGEAAIAPDATEATLVFRRGNCAAKPTG